MGKAQKREQEHELIKVVSDEEDAAPPQTSLWEKVGFKNK